MRIANLKGLLVLLTAQGAADVEQAGAEPWSSAGDRPSRRT
ncbi:hypothetical protein [Streptomyces sp. MMG1533]|nr:hypothetical protein [Streptomyces sp. MMG1533]